MNDLPSIVRKLQSAPRPEFIAVSGFVASLMDRYALAHGYRKRLSLGRIATKPRRSLRPKPRRYVDFWWDNRPAAKRLEMCRHRVSA